MRSSSIWRSPVHPLGAHPLETLLQLAEQALVHLLAEPQHQLLELLPGLGIDELVVLEAPHGAAEVLRQGVQGRAPLRGDPLELLAVRLGLGRAVLGRLPRALDAAVDAAPLGVENVLELLAQVAEDVAQIVAVEEGLALPPEPLEEVAEAGDLLPVPRAEALAEEPLERAPEIPVGDQVVGHRREHVVGVEVGKRLGAVPAGVAAPHALYRGPPAPRSLLSFRFRWSPSSTNSTAAATRAGCPEAPSRDIAVPKPAPRVAWRS